jgi:FkbM family methyltransferase
VRATKTLKRIGRAPFHAVGLEVVSRQRRQPKTFPTWLDRLRHAKDLGFAPRVIFDGGAYRGYWARDVSRLFDGAQLVVIEPNPYAREVIATTIADVRPAPIVVGDALGAAPGTASLHIWRENSKDRGASLLDHVSGEPRTTVDVTVRTLDSIAGELGLVPDFVKLDLQGGELAALQGSTGVLKTAELMLIEFGCLDAYIDRTTPRDLLDIMFENDYCLYDIVDCHYRPYDGALTGGDFIFVKNSSALRAYKGWE